MKSVDCNNLNFNIENNQVIKNLTFNLESGNRCLLVGSNGVGKTTLLKLLGGKNLCDNLFILGKHSYRDTSLNYERVLIDQNWGLRTVAFAGNNIPYIADIKVENMMSELQKEYPDRREKLVDLLEINLNWRMHLLSDGQRRRVQIFLGLLRPVKIILLDEITNVLDIICREKFLNWLKTESESNKVTIIYATHIFDGLDNWFTHVLHLKNIKNKTDEKSLSHFVTKEELSDNIYEEVKKWLIEEKKDDKDDLINFKSSLEKPYNSGGGFAPGRFYNYWG